MPRKLPEMLQDKTKSDIPKTPREKKMWIQARRIVAKQAGRTMNDDLTPGQWGLVTTIYKNAKIADKIPKESDWKDAKESKTVKQYKKDPKEDQKKNKMRELRDKYSTRA